MKIPNTNGILEPIEVREREVGLPKVSVIIALYNGKMFIEETLKSVLDQSFNDYELIVVDDGSTDNPQEVLAPYMDKIRYIHQPNSGGPAGAKNRGIKESTGKYLAFLDQDDLWHKNKLAKQVAILDNSQDVDLVASNVAIVSMDGKKVLMTVWPSPELWRETDIRQRLWQGNIILTSSSVAMRANFFKQNAPFNNQLKITDDYEMWLRVSRQGKIVLMPEVLTLWRYHSDNLSAGSDKTRQDAVKLYEILSSWPNLTEAETALINEKLATMDVRLANYYLANGQDDLALNIYRKYCEKGSKSDMVRKVLLAYGISPLLARFVVRCKMNFSELLSCLPRKRDINFPGEGFYGHWR